MRRAVLALASAGLAALPALAALAACGEGASPPAVDLGVAVTLPEGPVVPGRGFPLTVVRSWSKDLVPAAFHERALAPLVLRPETTSRRESASHVEETRRFRAYAFSREDVRVPPLRLSARPAGGGPERTVPSDGILVRVRPEVDADDPGLPETPEAPPKPPGPRWPVLAGLAAAALALGAFLLLRARRRAPPPPAAAPAPAGPSAAERALARLAALRARVPEDAAGARADVGEACETVRGFLAEGLGIPAFFRTTDELVADARAAGLAPVLAGCDAVKFAAASPDEAARLRLLDDAAGFVRAAEAGRAP
jgi:hypothetical protein